MTKEQKIPIPVRIMLIFMALLFFWFIIGNKLHPIYIEACNYCDYGNHKESVSNIILSRAKVLCSNNRQVQIDFEKCGTTWYGKEECKEDLKYTCN